MASIKLKFSDSSFLIRIWLQKVTSKKRNHGKVLLVHKHGIATAIAYAPLAYITNIRILMFLVANMHR